MSTSAIRWQRMLALLVTTVMVLALVSPLTAEAKTTNGQNGSVPGMLMKPVRKGISPALANIPVRDYRPTGNAAAFTDDPVNGPYLEKLGGLQIPRGIPTGNRPQTDATVPVSPPAKIVPDDPMPAVDYSWNGLNQGGNRTLFNFGVYPPDTNGDSSMYHYIETVNLTFAVWDYSQINVFGTGYEVVWGPAPVNVLFDGFGGACEYTNDGDPIVLYDEHADRWLISQFALPYFPSGPFSQCIAISATGDPLGAWYRYEYQFAKMNDYPKFGIWQDAYYMTINQFNPGTLSWGGQGVVAFDRNSMLSGLPANAFYFDLYGFDPNIGGMLPADNDGFWAPPGAPGITITADDDAWGYSPDQLQMWEWYVNWPGGFAVGTNSANLATNPFDSEVCAGYSRNCIPQPDTAVGLDALSDRLMYRLQYRNFGSYQTMVVNQTVDMNDPAGHAGIRWYELRNTGAGWFIYQQGDHSPDAAHRWMGSIAMDASGNIALGYSISDGTSMYPSIYYAGRKPADPLGTLPLTEGAIWLGGGSQTGTAYRWGDYSSMSVLPDGCTFVYANEYLRGTTPVEWYTSMGMFDFDADCTSVNTNGFGSQATYDGHVTEKSEFIEIGGSASASGGYIQVGDSSRDRQIKGFLSFDTSSLSGVVITNARVEMRLMGIYGTNPYDTHGALMVDYAAPYFGSAVSLAASDFEAATVLTDIGTCGSLSIGGWYACNLSPAAVNTGGTSQYRLYFSLADNDDGRGDYVKFASGNNPNAMYRPVLVVEYYYP